MRQTPATANMAVKPTKPGEPGSLLLCVQPAPGEERWGNERQPLVRQQGAEVRCETAHGEPSWMPERLRRSGIETQDGHQDQKAADMVVHRRRPEGLKRCQRIGDKDGRRRDAEPFLVHQASRNGRDREGIEGQEPNQGPMHRRHAVQECQARERERNEGEGTLRSERPTRVRQDERHRLIVNALQGLEQLHRIVPVESQCTCLKAVHEEAQQDDGCRRRTRAQSQRMPPFRRSDGDRILRWPPPPVSTC